MFPTSGQQIARIALPQEGAQRDEEYRVSAGNSMRAPNVSQIIRVGAYGLAGKRLLLLS
jgi:hypothetical protein